MTDDIVDQLELIETDSEGAHFAHVCGKAAETITRLRADLAAERTQREFGQELAKELQADLAAARALLRELLPQAKTASFDLLDRIDAALAKDEGRT